MKRRGLWWCVIAALALLGFALWLAMSGHATIEWDLLHCPTCHL